MHASIGPEMCIRMVEANHVHDAIPYVGIHGFPPNMYAVDPESRYRIFSLGCYYNTRIFSANERKQISMKAYATSLTMPRRVTFLQEHTTVHVSRRTISIVFPVFPPTNERCRNLLFSRITVKICACCEVDLWDAAQLQRKTMYFSDNLRNHGPNQLLQQQPQLNYRS